MGWGKKLVFITHSAVAGDLKTSLERARKSQVGADLSFLLPSWLMMTFNAITVLLLLFSPRAWKKGCEVHQLGT